MIRRLIDLVIAVMALAVLAIPLAFIAVLIRAESVGSPWYGGFRVGLHGRRFRMWKFRTMVQGADRMGPGITANDDPRVTRVGSFLRATKLDELPQFMNLLTGELTLVGPRAEVPKIVVRYSTSQRAVLEHKPGITGPGQLYYTTDQQQAIPKDEDPDDYYVRHLLGPKLAIDLDYLSNRTFWSDFSVVCRTVVLVCRGLSASLFRKSERARTHSGG